MCVHPEAKATRGHVLFGRDVWHGPPRLAFDWQVRDADVSNGTVPLVFHLGLLGLFVQGQAKGDGVEKQGGIARRRPRVSGVEVELLSVVQRELRSMKTARTRGQ